MKKERILFVCYANVHRSKAAEELYQADPRYEVRSAGIPGHARRGLTQQDISWADKLFVMDDDVLTRMEHHRQRNQILRRLKRYRTLLNEAGYPTPKEYPSLDGFPFINLGVPDEYDTSDPVQKARLMKLLRQKLAPYLGEPQL